MTGSAPAAFRRAVRSLERARPRPEVELERLRAPQRLTPWTHAIGARVITDGAEIATARLVLLHDPDSQEIWGGVLRLVAYLRAELDVELARDQLLAAVGWSWLTEALHITGAHSTALGGTVTQTSSVRFGEIAGPRRSDDVELRASWTPLGENLRPHADALCELIATAAGLPPVGVAALGQPRASYPS
ncbi:MAG: DUF3000 domain-containing protein [Actinomycetota bacterium]|nr:DUF3000 domain-containing protein [Actinomycetota bacterium]